MYHLIIFLLKLKSKLKLWKRQLLVTTKKLGIVIECTQIKEAEHKKERDEVKQLVFIFEMIDADSFRAIIEIQDEVFLEKLVDLGYKF